MAHSSRTWRGARTPQAMKRVRQDVRKQAVNRPHRSRTKTLVIKAVSAAQTGDAAEAQTALVAAVSALDRAAKSGAIHPNAAARRKSRLTLKVNAALGGEAIVGAAKAGRSTGKAAAAKAAKARVAASKAAKAKGEQTAAGKARAAALPLDPSAKAAQEPAARSGLRQRPRRRLRPAAGRKPAAKATGGKPAASKAAPAAKPAAKSASKAPAKPAAKAPAKAPAKPAAKAPAKPAPKRAKTARKAARPQGQDAAAPARGGPGTRSSHHQPRWCYVPGEARDLH